MKAETAGKWIVTTALGVLMLIGAPVAAVIVLALAFVLMILSGCLAVLYVLAWVGKLIGHAAGFVWGLVSGAWWARRRGRVAR